MDDAQLGFACVCSSVLLFGLNYLPVRTLLSPALAGEQRLIHARPCVHQHAHDLEVAFPRRHAERRGPTLTGRGPTQAILLGSAEFLERPSRPLTSK